jgi:hypothetical protein
LYARFRPHDDAVCRVRSVFLFRLVCQTQLSSGE